MLHYTRLERLAKDKQTSILGPFVSYKEKEVWGIQLLGPYSQQFFFVTCEWGKYARVLHYTKSEWLARDKHSSLNGPFDSCEENEELPI